MRRMKIVSGIISFLALCAVGGADASFLNAPHQDLQCVDCHVYPLSGGEWFSSGGAMVFPPASPTIDDRLRNYICTMCHDGSKAGIPGKKMHSSHSFTPGTETWSTLCVDCHDPHFQSQLQYKNDPGVFLATGTITGVDATSVAGQTTITVAGMTGKTTGAITGDWTAKTGAGRGLILIIDTTTPLHTYEIIGTNNGSVTVNGTVDPGDYVANRTVFGIIYGQLLRDKVYTGKDADGDGWGDYREMRFYDSEIGGYTGDRNADGVTDGVCQVCHTATSHWTQNVATDTHYNDKDCTGCHFVSEGFKPPFVPNHSTSGYVTDTALCVTCHTPNNPMGIHGSCQTCHVSITPGSITFIDPAGSNLVIAVQRGQCTTCHGDYFPNHTHHYGAKNDLSYNATVDTSQDTHTPCAECHTDRDTALGTLNGLSAFDAILYEHDLDGTKDGSKVTACASCHFYDGLASPPAADVASAISSGLAATCATCHTDKAPATNHGGHEIDFGWDGNCSSCHSGDVRAGVHKNLCVTCHGSLYTIRIAGDPANGVDGDARLAGDPNTYAATCLTCHPAAATKTGRATIHHDSKSGYAAAGTCGECHKATFPADHSTAVSQVVGDCDRCHLGTEGMSSGIAVNDLDDKKHDACTTCHNPDGTLITPPSVNGYATSMAAGTCAACHGDFFPSHVHHYGTNNDLSYNPAVDTSQSSASGCAQCHNDNSGALGLFTDILVEHKNVCNNCHLYDGTKTAPKAAVDAAISSGNPATCATCHTDKVPNVTHGHDTSDFGFGTSTCISCHDDNGSGVIIGVHGNVCDNCHVDVASGDFSRKIGDVANGVDGNALLATGATARQATCATCHPTTTYPTKQIHHESKNGYAAAWNCAACHNDTVKPDHSQRVAPYANCTLCHAATAGTVDGIVVNDLDNTMHDACSSCHTLVGNVVGLIDPANNPLLIGMPVGGGTCAACHGEYFDKHANIDHGARISGVDAQGAALPCIACHTATAANGTVVPLDTNNHKVHDACATCHQADGALVVIPTTNGWATAMPVGGGNCMNCHGDYFPEHDHHFGNALYTPNQVAYNPTVDTSQPEMTSCANCHNHNDYGNSLATFMAILMEHDNDGVKDASFNTCYNCHEYDGRSSAPQQAVLAAIAQASGAVNCGTCHTNRVPNVEHGGHPATDFAFDSNCATCHSDGGNGVVKGIHTNSCIACHTDPYNGVYTRKLGDAANGVDGDARLAVGGNARQATCTVCHPQNLYAHGTTADHDKRLTLSECVGCHHQVSSAAAVDSTHRGDCFTCHGYNGTKLNKTIVQNAIKNGKGPNGTAVNCRTCHTAGHSTTTDHNNRVTTGMTINCANCHSIGSQAAIDTLHVSCTVCHASTKGDVVAAINNGKGTAGSPQNCEKCHNGTAGSANAHGYTPAAVAPVHDRFAAIAPCSNCHAVATAADRITLHRSGDCMTCHAATASATVKNAIAAGINGTEVNCTTCHGTDVRAAHHAATQAKNGNCVYCHADSRPWAGAPSLMACRQCHVVSNRVVTNAPAPSHAINDTTKPITDFGACFACHPVMPFHAGVPTGRVRDYCSTGGPGRGSFNLFYNQLHGSESNGTRSCDNNEGRYRNPSISYRTATLRFGSTTYVVPHFDSSNTTMPIPQHNRIQVPADCTSCHSGNVATAIHTNNCFGCHMSTDPVVRAALGYAAKGNTVTCTDCHSAVSGGHDAPAVHDMLNVTGVTCGNCHVALGSGSFNEIVTLHRSDCMTCHGSTDTMVKNAIASGKNGTTVTCNTCHGATASAAHHAGTQAKTGNCDYCHADTRPWATAPKLLACRQCHTNSSGYVVTASPAPSHAHNTQGAIKNFGACLSCHEMTIFHAKPVTTPLPNQTAPGRGSFNLFYNSFNRPEKYYKGTQWENEGERNLKPNRTRWRTPQISFRNATLNMGGTTYVVPHFDPANVTMPATPSHARITVSSGCVNCHVVSNIIPGIHNNDCLGCHMSQDSVVQATITAGRAGTTVQCTNCHTAAVGDHNAPQVHNYLQSGGNCNTASCHSGYSATDFNGILSIHLNDCMKCHGSADQNVKNAITAGKAGTGVATCGTCHAALHHATTRAKAGDCAWCHDDPRLTWINSTPGDNGGSAPYPTQLACVTCHVRFSNGTIYIDKLTYSNNGNTAARTVQHTITGNTSGYIYNYGACFSCHNGVNALAPSPFHAKPTAASSRRYENQVGPGRGTFNVFWNEFHGREDASFGTKSYNGNENRYQNPASGYGTKKTIPCRTISNNDCTGSPIAVPVLPAKPVPNIQPRPAW